MNGLRRIAKLRVWSLHAALLSGALLDSWNNSLALASYNAAWHLTVATALIMFGTVILNWCLRRWPLAYEHLGVRAKIKRVGPKHQFQVFLLTVMFWVVAWWSETHPQPAWVGMLRPNVSFLSFFVKNHPLRDLVVGGTTFRMIGSSDEFIRISGRTGLALQSEREKLLLTTRVHDRQGRLVGEIVRNEWRVRPVSAWDRNYTSDALEVRDESGDVVLQVRMLPTAVHLQAKFHCPSDSVAFVAQQAPRKGAAFVKGREYVDRVRIKPIFRYPSDFNMGELDPN